MKNRHFCVAEDLEEVTTRWLWDPYIPYGRVTFLHGEESVGKTMLAIKLMAAVIGKAKMDRMGDKPEKGRCLYLTKEERLSAVIKPKLKEAGANLKDILIINDNIPITLADDSLKEIIRKEGISLMVIDPLSSYLEKEEGLANNPGAVYPIIKKLSDLAEETGCAILVIEKSDGTDCFQSKAWRAGFDSCVSSFLCLEWEDESAFEERWLFHEYSLLSVEGDPIAYELTPGKGLKCV